MKRTSFQDKKRSFFNRRSLIIMLKEPRPGRVKTRLGHDIGMVQAAWWFRKQALAVIRRLRDARWEIILAVSPDVEGLSSRVWPIDIPRLPQGNGNLGDRLKRLLMSRQMGHVCIIGSDIPDVSRTWVWEAFLALGNSDIVIGPSFDGGYWLIGARAHRALPKTDFSSVRWSTKFALADTLVRMNDRRVAQISQLRDIDNLSDLKQCASSHRRYCLPY